MSPRPDSTRTTGVIIACGIRPRKPRKKAGAAVGGTRGSVVEGAPAGAALRIVLLKRRRGGGGLPPREP